VDRALLAKLTILEHTAASSKCKASRHADRCSGPLEIRAMNDPARFQRVSRPRPINSLTIPWRIFPRRIKPPSSSRIRWSLRDRDARRDIGFTSSRRDDKDLSGAKSNGINDGVDDANSVVIRASLIMRADPPEIAANRERAWRNAMSDREK